MKRSCINHRPNSRMVLIREDFLQICEGNHCAAALLEYLMSLQGTAPCSGRDLHGAMLQTWGLGKIREAINLLEEKQFIHVTANPDPRYSFDKTKHLTVQRADVLEALGGL